MQLDNFKQLLSRSGAICKHHNDISRISGADFNVFKIVKVIEDEVRHSAFLAELLHPGGSHGQGDLFLRLFVKKFGIECFQCETATIEVEKRIGPVTETSGGRIDIFIDDKNGNHIIIENKIYANDEENQLIRYYNFRNHNLFYLTLYGSDAKDRSITSLGNGMKLESNKDYKLLSYKTDIVEWLELCQKEAVSMPLLREGIAHYINLIKFLTGESINKAMSQEIVNLISESPTNLANAKEISTNFSQAQSKIQWEFWKAIENAFIRTGIILEENKNTVTYEKVLNYYRRKDRYFGLWSLIYQNNDITIHWGCEIDSNVYLGFTIENKGIGGISDLVENSKYREIIKECDSAYNPGKYWLGWQYTRPQLNFREFNLDAVFNLADKRELEKTVLQIATKAKKDIIHVQTALNKLVGSK